MNHFEEDSVPSRTGVVTNVNTEVTYVRNPDPQYRAQVTDVTDVQYVNTDLTISKEEQIKLVKVEEYKNTAQIVGGSVMMVLGLILGAHSLKNGKLGRAAGATVLVGSGLYAILDA